MDINEFANLPDIAKRSTLNLAQKMTEIQKRNSIILESINRKHHHVTFVIDDIAVLESHGNDGFDDAKFTFAIMTNDKWSGGRSYYADAELAFLGALGEKHDGKNSQFAHFAALMLGKSGK